MIKLDVLKDGIDKTMEILGQHFSHPKLESIGRSRITVQFFDMPTTIFKFSKLYYVVKDRFGSPWIIESTDAIDALVEMYDELQTKRNNEVALFAQTSRSLLDKRKDNVHLRRQLAENKRLISKLSTNSFSLDIVLDLLASMHQGTCPGAFAHWDIEKDAFDYGKQSTLDSSDFIDLAYSKAYDLGIEKEFCKYMDSLPTMIEKDWMEGYERRQRLKESKIGKDIMLDEEARKNSPHYVEDIAKTVVEHSIENPVMNITIEIFSSPESPTSYKALIANDFTIAGQGLFVEFLKGHCILYGMIYESNEVAIRKTLELINDPNVNPIGDLICGVAKDFWKVINEARGHGWTVNFHVVEEPKVLPSPEAILVDAQHYLGELNEEAILPQSEAPELVISLTTSRPWKGVMHLELHSMLELPTGTLPKGCALATFYLDKLSEYEAAQSYLDMIIYPSKWTLLGYEQYMKTKGWLHVWQVHLQDLQKLHQQGWKIDMYVNSGTKLVDPQLPPIREGSFVSNEPVEELTPVEEVAPDPEPSVAEQEVMQNEANEAREVVNVYVRLRIKLVNRRKVQVLELVDTIYYGVLHSGQEIVDDIPFNMDIHTVVKDLNTRNCLMPRTDPDKSIKIFPNFTSYAQEVYRNGKAVQLVIGVPTE